MAKGKGPKDLQILRQATQRQIKELERKKEQCRQVADECRIERRVEAAQRITEKRAERRKRAEQRRAIEQEIKRRSGEVRT